MYNFLIFNNNLKIIKKVLNSLFEFSNFRLSGITNLKSELNSLYEKSHANLIIISYEDSIKPSMKKALENYQYKIFICNNENEFKNSKYNLYISTNLPEKELANKFRFFLHNLDERAVKSKVIDILNTFNFDFKLNGTTYLLEAIVYSYFNKNNYIFENLEKKIFPYVAKKYNVSANNVKFSIIRSINNMNSRISTQSLKDKYSNFPDKITSKALINEIVNRI